MQAKGKPIIILVVTIMLVGQLLGEISAAGKLLIPTAKAAEKPYIGVITITPAAIMIKCAKKIFQPFNEFDIPKKEIIQVNPADVEEIQIQETKMIIVTKDSFWKRYRNISSMVYKSKYTGLLSWTIIQKWALIFVVDNPADMVTVEELIKVIGRRCLVTTD